MAPRTSLEGLPSRAHYIVLHQDLNPFITLTPGRRRLRQRGGAGEAERVRVGAEGERPELRNRIGAGDRPRLGRVVPAPPGHRTNPSAGNSIPGEEPEMSGTLVTG